MFKKFLYYWNNYRFESLVVLSLVALLIFFLFDRKYDNKSDFTLGTLSKKKRIPLKYESKCRNIIENYYKAPFTKCRPDFLRYKNGKNLELDGFNKDLGIAFEYNGAGHYKYTPFFHKSYKDFEDQKDRDTFKEQKCKEVGIKLISIPHNIRFWDLERYILGQISSVQ